MSRTGETVFLAQALWPILAVEYALPPFFIVQIPLNGFSNAASKGFLWLPTDIAGNFAGINGITKIMTWPIFNKGNQVTITLDASRFVGSNSSSRSQRVSTTSILDFS